MEHVGSNQYRWGIQPQSRGQFGNYDQRLQSFEEVKLRGKKYFNWKNTVTGDGRSLKERLAENNFYVYSRQGMHFLRRLGCSNVTDCKLDGLYRTNALLNTIEDHFKNEHEKNTYMCCQPCEARQNLRLSIEQYIDYSGLNRLNSPRRALDLLTSLQAEVQSGDSSASRIRPRDGMGDIFLQDLALKENCKKLYEDFDVGEIKATQIELLLGVAKRCGYQSEKQLDAINNLLDAKVEDVNKYIFTIFLERASNIMTENEGSIKSRLCTVFQSIESNNELAEEIIRASMRVALNTCSDGIASFIELMYSECIQNTLFDNVRNESEFCRALHKIYADHVFEKQFMQFTYDDDGVCKKLSDKSESVEFNLLFKKLAGYAIDFTVPPTDMTYSGIAKNRTLFFSFFKALLEDVHDIEKISKFCSEFIQPPEAATENNGRILDKLKSLRGNLPADLRRHNEVFVEKLTDLEKSANAEQIKKDYDDEGKKIVQDHLKEMFGCFYREQPDFVRVIVDMSDNQFSDFVDKKSPLDVRTVIAQSDIDMPTLTSGISDK